MNSPITLSVETARQLALLSQGLIKRRDRTSNRKPLLALIKQIGLIHRGFSSYGNTEYRNAPMWHLAIEMKRRNPELMMINDPSHISGRRDILLDVAQKAIDLDFDGLIIESHIDPDKAWSDAKQQIYTSRLLRADHRLAMSGTYSLGLLNNSPIARGVLVCCRSWAK